MRTPCLLLLLLLLPSCPALQTPVIPSDILSSIHEFRRTLLDLLAKGMATASSSPSSPRPRPPQHTILLPPRPPVPQDLTRPGHGFSPSSSPPHHMVQAVHTVQQHIAEAFPHIQMTHTSLSHSSPPSFSPSFSPFHSPPSAPSAPSSPQHLKPGVAGALVHGPHSFVDSTRVHAGEEVAEALAHDPNAVNHVPADLWREDLVGIKTHTKEQGHHDRRVLRRAVRRRRGATPAPPFLSIE